METFKKLLFRMSATSFYHHSWTQRKTKKKQLKHICSDLSSFPNSLWSTFLDRYTKLKQKRISELLDQAGATVSNVEICTDHYNFIINFKITISMGFLGKTWIKLSSPPPNCSVTHHMLKWEQKMGRVHLQCDVDTFPSIHPSVPQSSSSPSTADAAIYLNQT